MRRVVAVKLHKLPAGNDQKRHTPAPGKSGAMGQPWGARCFLKRYARIAKIIAMTARTTQEIAPL